MSEIKAGDLVMVVRGTCGCALGKIYPVLGVEHRAGRDELRCSCGYVSTAPMLRAHLAGRKTSGYHPLAWLKKIDPLSEPDAEVYREEKKQPRELSKT